MAHPGRTDAKRRPLRWVKFAGGLAAAAITLSLAYPSLLLIAEVVRGPFLEAPALRELLPSLASALVAASGLVWLVVDASFDRRAPRWVVALLVANLLLVSGALPSKAPGGAGSDAAIAAALREAKVQLERPLALRERLRSLHEGVTKLPATSIRDHLFRPLAPGLVVLEDREGPQLTPPEGVAPATIFVAINPERSAAWLTATTLEGRRSALLRDGGLPVILGIPLCSSNAPSGGTPC